MSLNRKVGDVLLFRRMTRRNRIIATVLVVLITTAACTAFWAACLRPDYHDNPKPPGSPFDYQPKPPAQLISSAPPDVQEKLVTLPDRWFAVTVADHLGPSGTYAACNIERWYLVLYQHCALLFQPETTYALNEWFKRQGGTAVGAMVATMTTVCAALSLGSWVFVCGIIATFFATEILYWTNQAAQHKQCLRFDYNIFPWPGGVPTAFKVSAYGQWQRWIYYYGPHGETLRRWGYPTHCLMPRDCYILPGIPCIV